MLLLVWYQVFRFAFFWFNQQFFGPVDIVQLLGGLRFDLSIISYTNLPLVLAHVVVGEFKYRPQYQQVVKLIFFTINAVFFFTAFVDFEYYQFTRVRSTFNLITGKGMEADIVRLIPSFLLEFWYLVVLFLVTLFVFWKTIPTQLSISQKQKDSYYRNIVLQSFSMILLLGLSVLAGRGGFQRRPLDRVDALQYATPQNVAVVLNTPFSVFRTIGKKVDIAERHYFKPDSLDQIFSPIEIYQDSVAMTQKNVVVIILESFGQENIGFYNQGIGYTPFLDSLINQSLVFKNGFANGKLSMDAVPSVLAGIPSLMTNSYISSVYGANSLNAYPNLLKKKNYHTSFFHGAFNGSQNFDKFTPIVGVDQYYGMNEYPNEDGRDGAWGIFDEEFMQFFCMKKTEFNQPFLSVLFSVSSHNPYTIPERYKGKFPPGTANIHESIGYADFALKQYFVTARKQGWYNNTLFAITADHTSSEGTGYYAGDIGKYLVPIIFFDPSNAALKGVDDRIFQQADIMPYVLNYLHYSGKFINYGNHADAVENRFAINYSNGVYHFMYDDYYLMFDGQKVLGAFRWKEDRLLKQNLYNTADSTIQKAETFLKAYIQSFNDRVINNKLTP